MRVRTLMSFATGLAAGAGWMYLKDPDLGPGRRRELRRDALRRSRRGAAAAAIGARRRAGEIATSAVSGFEQGRQQGRPSR